MVSCLHFILFGLNVSKQTENCTWHAVRNISQRAVASVTVDGLHFTPIPFEFHSGLFHLSIHVNLIIIGQIVFCCWHSPQFGRISSCICIDLFLSSSRLTVSLVASFQHFLRLFRSLDLLMILFPKSDVQCQFGYFISRLQNRTVVC